MHKGEGCRVGAQATAPLEEPGATPQWPLRQAHEVHAGRLDKQKAAASKQYMDEAFGWVAAAAGPAGESSLSHSSVSVAKAAAGSLVSGARCLQETSRGRSEAPLMALKVSRSWAELTSTAQQGPL